MGTDKAWQRWGDTDPYFGVLTHDRFRADTIANHRGEFFATGENDIDVMISRYERYFGPLPRGSALDFGCGVGRLSLALAQRFDRVDGLDISEAMLAEARINAERLGVTGTSFALSDDTLSAFPEQYDFVNSFIVLQHIPVARGLPIIKHLLDRVRPGGGCMIHVALERRATGLRRLAYRLRHNVPFGNAVVNLIAGHAVSRPAMQMNEYPIPAVLSLFVAYGMSDMIARADDHNGVMTLAISAKRYQ